MKFFPDFLVGPTDPREPRNAPRAVGRVKRGEVDQLHGYAAGRAIQRASHCNYGRIASVHLAEWKTEVQITYHDQLVARPRPSRRRSLHRTCPSGGY